MGRDEPADRTALPKVLVVDDEQRVLDSMRMMFRHRYDLFLAADSQTAIDILDRNDVDVIVADREMPSVSGLEILALAHERFPQTVGILLTDNSAVEEIAGALAEIGVFRVMQKPIAPSQLRIAIELAMRAAEPGLVTAALTDAIDPSELLAERILAADPLPELDQAFSDRLASVEPDAIDRAALGGEIPAPDERAPLLPLDVQRPDDGVVEDSSGVVVFSNDANLDDCVRRAAAGRFPIHVATNVVQAVKLLHERDLGVLVTDVARDHETARSMLSRLREHRPELVAIVVADAWDATDRVALINGGLVFRFLREPVTIGRCSVALQAAVQHLDATRRFAAQPPAASAPAPRTEDSGTFSGVFERLKAVKRLLA